MSSDWASHINEIKRSKMTVPYDTSAYHGRERVTTRTVKVKERSFDPVLQVHIDKKEESRNRISENDSTRRRTERARQRRAEREKRCKTPYDVITQELKPLCQELPQRVMKKVPDTRTPYHLLNHSKLDTGRYVETNETKSNKSTRNTSSTEETDRKLVRGYNIVSNKYFEDNERKTTNEKRAIRDRCEKKYWDTHNYDPVTASYYDKAKEKEYLRMRAKLEKDFGKNANEWLPQTTKHSEGNLYNIVNHGIKHTERFKARVDRDTRRVQSKERASRFEQQQGREREEQARKQSLRSFNRLSPKRNATNRGRGFDLITNQSFKGMNAKSLPTDRRRQEAKLWTKMSSAKTGLFSSKRDVV